MAEKELSTEEIERWFIDLDWFHRNGRSVLPLLRGCLCAKCRQQLSSGEKEASETELLATIANCCCHAPEFITGQQPVLESIFRLFLANGNQPLSLAELGEQLSQRRGGDAYRTLEEILLRLLKNDRYYGLRPAPD